MEGYDREGLHRPERNQSLDGGSESCLRFSESQKESRSMRRAAFLDDAACRKTTRSRGNPFLRAVAQQKFLPPGIPLGTKFSAETRTRRKAARTLSVLNFPVCVLSIRTCRLDRTFLTVCTRAAGGAKQWPRAMQARGRFWLWKVFSQGRWRAVRRRRTGCNRLRRPGKRPLRRPRQSRLRGRPVRRIRRPPPPGRQRARDPACRRL